MPPGWMKISLTNYLFYISFFKKTTTTKTCFCKVYEAYILFTQSAHLTKLFKKNKNKYITCLNTLYECTALCVL